MAVVLQCPICEDKFRWDFAEKSKWPTKCPSCHEVIHEDKPDDEICMPAFLSAKTKRTDAVYDQMAAGSEVRAQAAADLAGCSVADMSSLKITDLKSTKHQGEVAAPQVVNDVTIRMDQMRARGLPTGYGVPNAQEYAGAVSTGAFANSGAMIHNSVRDSHAAISRGTAVSEIPVIDAKGVPIKPRIPYRR